MNYKLKLIAIAVALLVMPSMALAGGEYIGSTATGVPSLGDPCESYTHQSAPLALASATTTVVISNHASGTGNIYICGISASIISSATLQLINGTGTRCATAPTVGVANLTGPIAGAVIIQTADTLGSKLTVPAGNDVCAVGTGAGSDANGWIDYVVAPR